MDDEPGDANEGDLFADDRPHTMDKGDDMFSKDQEGDLWAMVPALHRELAETRTEVTDLHEHLLRLQLGQDQLVAHVRSIADQVSAMVLGQAVTNKHMGRLNKEHRRRRDDPPL